MLMVPEVGWEPVNSEGALVGLRVKMLSLDWPTLGERANSAWPSE